jgi:cell division protein FtsB
VSYNIAVVQATKKLWDPTRFKQITDVRNVGFYIFAVIALAIAWSGVKTVQNNYELQRQIAILKQQNEVLQLSNQNTGLESQFYETDQYLELAARQNLGLAAPGETVLLVPKSVAMKHVDSALTPPTSDAESNDSIASKSKFSQNFQDWRDFLLGRQLFD